MFNKQKGLVQAVNNLFPYVEHKFYVSHLHINIKHVGFRGKYFKVALWKVARASTTNYFHRKIEALVGHYLPTYEWLQYKMLRKWSRSHNLASQSVTFCL